MQSQQIMNDSNLFEILNCIMKHFKQIIQVFNKIVIELDCKQSIQQFSQQCHRIANSISIISTKYKDGFKNNQTTNLNTLNRFSCRLMEMASFTKINNHSVINQQISRIFLDQFFDSLRLFRENFNLTHFLRKLGNIVKNIVKKVLEKKQEIEMPNSQLRKNLSLKSNQSKMPPIQKSKISETNLNKILNAINNNFKSLACMDLDYHTYRSTFFQTKSLKTQIYEQCLARNKSIQNAIAYYSKKSSQNQIKQHNKRYNKALKQQSIDTYVSQNQISLNLKLQKKVLSSKIRSVNERVKTHQKQLRLSSIQKQAKKLIHQSINKMKNDLIPRKLRNQQNSNIKKNIQINKISINWNNVKFQAQNNNNNDSNLLDGQKKRNSMFLVNHIKRQTINKLNIIKYNHKHIQNL